MKQEHQALIFLLKPSCQISLRQSLVVTGVRAGGRCYPPFPQTSSVRCKITANSYHPIFAIFFRRQWRRPGSNRQPPACKAGALPIELHPHLGVRGFEPRTSALSELRSNQLSYTPSDETLKGFGPKRRMLKIFFSKFKWTRHRKTILRHQAAYSATFFVFSRPNGNAYKDISAGLDEREVSSIFNLSEL